MTLPEFPAEIRAPVGTTFGVSAYQIQFGPPDVLTPGDSADVLIAFNPAALKTNKTTKTSKNTAIFFIVIPLINKRIIIKLFSNFLND